jgi:D-alanine-D-alanine ligase
MTKIRVAVVFGSRSVEHEVSIVTAMQIFTNIDREKYEVIPIYIDKQGRWNTGKNLDKLESYKNLELVAKNKLVEFKMPDRVGQKMLYPVKNNWLGGGKPVQIDVVFPAVHGTYGEDGTLQGLLEMVGIPYVGCGVTASAVGMDKVIQKALFEKEGLPVVKYVWFTKDEWQKDKKKIIVELEKKLGYPMCVKPANLGSSVGINIPKNRKELEWAVEVAKEFDRKILVEEGLVGIDEINVSVMGLDELEVSVCEQPIKTENMLTYEGKYMKGGKVKGMAGLSRMVPAPIKPILAERIQGYAKTAFRAIGGSGISRIDFLVDIKKEKVYINEVNTLPGSLSYYLWEKSGYTFPKLIDRLIELAVERSRKNAENQHSFDSKLLQATTRGTKG